MPYREPYQWETEDRWIDEPELSALTDSALASRGEELRLRRNALEAQRWEVDREQRSVEGQIFEWRQECIRRGLKGEH